jgi:maltose O-acetyltransferase
MGEMKRRMLRGELFRGDDELWHDIRRAAVLCDRYNSTPFTDQPALDAILAELVAEVGEDVIVKPPFYCDYGVRIAIGARTFINYDCVMLDGAPIRIGAHCQIAPRVQLLTATHPIDPGPRRAGWESAAPITVGDNVWLGAGAIVCPGVEIGADTVVGAGAVVVRDLPAGVVVAGVPARVVREITDADRVDVPGY